LLSYREVLFCTKFSSGTAIRLSVKIKHITKTVKKPKINRNVSLLPFIPSEATLIGVTLFLDKAVEIVKVRHYNVPTVIQRQ